MTFKLNHSSSMDVLNDDILRQIFHYLHLDDKIRLRRINSRWKYLLDEQLAGIKALRLGQFTSGGYNITSGLTLTNCDHNTRNRAAHRHHTGTIFDDKLCKFPADLETQCFSINQYDYLYRSIKFSYSSITVLSLGRLNISYRLLMVIASNLPKLEHLELIGCASIVVNNLGTGKSKPLACRGFGRPIDENIPSIETFNNSEHANQNPFSSLLFNQHQDEELNMKERLARSAMIKNCDLIKESRTNNNLPKLRHLLIKDCNLLNEFSLCLILALTQQTLVHLVVQSNQYLTGEFLNYCGPKLDTLKIIYCPQLQARFLEDLVKLRQLLSNKEENNIQLVSSSSSVSMTSVS